MFGIKRLKYCKFKTQCIFKWRKFSIRYAYVYFYASCCDKICQNNNSDIFRWKSWYWTKKFFLQLWYLHCKFNKNMNMEMVIRSCFCCKLVVTCSITSWCWYLQLFLLDTQHSLISERWDNFTFRETVFGSTFWFIWFELIWQLIKGSHKKNILNCQKRP